MFSKKKNLTSEEIDYDLEKLFDEDDTFKDEKDDVDYNSHCSASSIFEDFDDIPGYRRKEAAKKISIKRDSKGQIIIKINGNTQPESLPLSTGDKLILYIEDNGINIDYYPIPTCPDQD